MKPPRFPGTEKFRFCDKKYDQQSRKSLELDCDDHPDSVEATTPTTAEVHRKDSILFNFNTRSLSNESLLCLCTSHRSDSRCTSSNDSQSSPCTTLGELISTSSLLHPLATQLEIGGASKRKPSLPISSRQLTSRVFTITNYFRHRSKNDEDVFYHENSGPAIYVSNEDQITLPRRHFHKQCECVVVHSRPSTPSSLDSSGGENTPPELSDTKCRLRPVPDSLRLHHGSNHAATNLMINATSHTSLMSDESSTSLCSSNVPHSNECDDSLRSFSCSPVEHWAKRVASPNRLSTSSQSSWEDGSIMPEIT